MPIVVPDINVLVSALINRSSPPGRIIAAWRRREIVFVTSQTIIDKVDEVLHRPIFASYGITDAQIARLRKALHKYAVRTPHTLNLQVIKEDPEDDTILIAAVEGHADCIISGDKHLKDLGQYQGIPILTPADFVTRYNIP